MPKQIEMISYLKLFATVSPKHTVSKSFFFCHSSIRNIQSLFHLTICLLQDHNLPSHCLEARSVLSRTVIFFSSVMVDQEPEATSLISHKSHCGFCKQHPFTVPFFLLPFTIPFRDLIISAEWLAWYLVTMHHSLFMSSFILFLSGCSFHHPLSLEAWHSQFNNKDQPSCYVTYVYLPNNNYPFFTSFTTKTPSLSL